MDIRLAFVTLLVISMCVAFPSNLTQIISHSNQVRHNGQYYRYVWFKKVGSTESEAKATAADVMFKEAIILATAAFVAVDANDPIFLRYFEPGDAALVKGSLYDQSRARPARRLNELTGIFEQISGAADGNIQFGSKKFRNLWLSEGTSQFAAIKDKCENPNSIKQGLEAFGTQNLPGQPPRVGPDNYAISLCPCIFAWPALMKMSCECFGLIDSYRMNSGGASLLHELVHWRLLTAPAPGFDDMVGTLVVDYTKPATGLHFADPASGYGPQFASQLVGHANGDARKNADNYRWYALSKYWHDRCKPKTFEASNNNLDGIPESVLAATGGEPVAVGDQAT